MTDASSRRPVWAAMASLVSIGGFVSWTMIAPGPIPVGGALVSMACLAGALHAIGRAHAGP